MALNNFDPKNKKSKKQRWNHHQIWSSKNESLCAEQPSATLHYELYVQPPFFHVVWKESFQICNTKLQSLLNNANFKPDQACYDVFSGTSIYDVLVRSVSVKKIIVPYLEINYIHLKKEKKKKKMGVTINC